MKLSRPHPGGEPANSLALVEYEQLRLGSHQLLKDVQEEISYVDIHYLPVIHKLHLRGMKKEQQNTLKHSEQISLYISTRICWLIS